MKCTWEFVANPISFFAVCLFIGTEALLISIFNAPEVHDDSCQVGRDQSVDAAARPWQKDTWYQQAGPQRTRQDAGQVDTHDSPPPWKSNEKITK